MSNRVAKLGIAAGLFGGGAVASPLLTGLVAYWKMDEASDGSAPVTRVDALGAHNLTDVNNIPSDTGILSSAASMTAANAEQLTAADHANLKGNVGDFTLDLWFKVPNVTGTKLLVCKGTGNSGSTHEYSMFLSDAGVVARVSSGTAFSSPVIGTATANTWTYAVMWYVAATGVIWGQVNNGTPVSLAITGAGATANATTGLLRFGALPAGTTTYTVMVDEAARWNRVLTADERLDRWNNGSGNTYPF